MTTTAPNIATLRVQDLPQSEQARLELERRKRQRAHIPEAQKCADDFVYFVLNYVHIYDGTEKKWIPFILWKEQQDIAIDLTVEKLVIILKARQLGMTWLVLAYALWLMLFHPAATVLLFSLRDTEAVYLLSDERLRGMYKKLPSWLMMRKWKVDKAGTEVYEWVPRSVTVNGGHLWTLGNGSTAKAFPTSAGDSYTATLAIVDEADLVPDLSALLLRVKPTIDGGGQLFLVSKVNKALPLSEFKGIYRGAKAKINGWKGIFLAWWVRPSRTPEWYERQKRDAESRIGGTDDLYENYPATDAEALAPKQLDKRLPYRFLAKVYHEEQPTPVETLQRAPTMAGLRLYMLPRKNKQYVIGADPAEGNPNSDDSAMQVVDVDTGSQCAVLSGKFDVDVFASYIETLSEYYADAPALVERNNHGHAVLANLRNTTKRKKVRLINGEDKKPGYQSNKRTKVVLYDDLAQTISTDDCMIFDAKTFEQLSSIEGATLLAPEGMHEDEADAFALAQKARMLKPPASIAPMVAGQRNTGLGNVTARPALPAPVRPTAPVAMVGRVAPSIGAKGRIKRIAIIGWPGTGKTTLAQKLSEELGIPYRSTDDVINLGWGADSLEVASWLDESSWIIEGVALPRALRKWRELHPDEKAPVDKVIRLKKVHRALPPGAISMGKGVDTVINEIQNWLPKIESSY